MKWLARKIVVVPVDFSDLSFAALEGAREMTDDPTQLHVVHVLPILEPADPGIVWHTVDDQSRSRHASEALQKELARRGHDRVQIVVRFGDPGNEIAQYAEQCGAGLVIVSSHGRSGFKRLLIGSVAERIVRLAHCPVLVLKP